MPIFWAALGRIALFGPFSMSQLVPAMSQLRVNQGGTKRDETSRGALKYHKKMQSILFYTEDLL